jgi:tyrosine-protein kinase Etk/Wzc
LTDVATGQARPDEALRDAHHPGLQIVAAGAPTTDAAEMFASDALRQCLEELSRRADIVIVDAPPVASTPEGQVLSRAVDATILVVALGQTQRVALAEARRRLTMAGADLLGVVVTNADGPY